MEKPAYRHLFGPVPSRRFGRSLGVDLTPFKTCSFDCVFCQLGRTTVRTTERREYVPVDEVAGELEDWSRQGGTADYITLAGSGEPTLHARFGEVIAAARAAAGIPVALLTNGSLLTDPEVRDQAAGADVVKVSLSAWDQHSLEHVNRPAPGIRFESLIEGQRRFRELFSGELWLEVFLVWGVNTTPRDVERIADLAASLRPDRIQLNTAVRPPCEEYVDAVPEEQLHALTGFFDPPAEVIAEYSRAAAAGAGADEREVLAMLERRPCTLEQVCRAFGLHRNEASKYLGRLLRTGSVARNRVLGVPYYSAVHGGAGAVPVDRGTRPGPDPEPVEKDHGSAG
jgi:wyosine [tRNA(Phe)-imidazoG37] synthetase (radical SAM superfamily)